MACRRFFTKRYGIHILAIITVGSASGSFRDLYVSKKLKALSAKAGLGYLCLDCQLTPETIPSLRMPPFSRIEGEGSYDFDIASVPQTC